MLKILLTIGIIGIVMVVLALATDIRLFDREQPEEIKTELVVDTVTSVPDSETVVISENKIDNSAKRRINPAKTNRSSNKQLRDSIVTFAKKHLGTPYIYACAIEGKGFDCSGFTYFVYKEFDIDIPRSSGHIAKAGTPIPYNLAAKGDIVVFTGTDKSVRQPGHVGIIIENNGEGIKFIHSSSGDNNVGVIISEVEGTGYEDRFLEVRRVINES